VLLKLANVEGYSGNSERAVKILEEAVAQVKETMDWRVRLQAHHNLTLWMVDAGQALEALARYEKSRSFYDEHCTEPALALRRRWLEGRIYAALGDLDLARTAFEEVRATAAARGLSYEVAMVTLELAIVHLDHGETNRVQDLAEEMTPIFRSHELHRYALAAVYLFRHAARSETLTTGFAREILRYLQRARHNPYLRFEPSTTRRA
jgi:tetratricopeptide (TPR) repeat protein